MLNDTGTTVTWSSLVSGVAPQKQVDLQSDLEARKLPMPVTLVDLYKCCSFCYAAPANQSTMTCTAHTHAHTADCVNINSYLEKCFLIGFVCMVLPTTDFLNNNLYWSKLQLHSACALKFQTGVINSSCIL